MADFFLCSIPGGALAGASRGVGRYQSRLRRRRQTDPANAAGLAPLRRSPLRSQGHRHGQISRRRRSAVPARPTSSAPGPLGSHGPYNLRLLIQPGPPGHILGVVDITKAHLTDPGNPASGPSVANRSRRTLPEQPAGPPPQTRRTQAPAPSRSRSSSPAGRNSSAALAQRPRSAAQQPSEPTADTPSGPILDSGSQGSPNSVNPASHPRPTQRQPANSRFYWQLRHFLYSPLSVSTS